ncbi:hypothetical protein SAMN05660831_00281 [Thiohalospira halophila DSM 15071]|uniref:Uncharacterized protein n=1 Tax=Thiohalospira halophila DSM 15071 TaxID=1123397 RepID=A0A1I1NHG0_9GAMM|nr:hypothetical protein [Thiohalospira halophila]SFC97069.1 hypothetical protein SAMN05660831_00281 [Thiohalospira halophila DSM 15071]
MQLGSSDVETLAGAIEDANHIIIEAWTERGPGVGPDEVSPELLSEALGQYVEILRKVEGVGGEPPESDSIFDTIATAGGGRKAGEPVTTGGMSSNTTGADPDDITQLGDYGLSLLHDQSEWARRLGLEAAAERLNGLNVAIALWVARHGGELNQIDGIVNVLASVANRTADPDRLRELANAMGEIAHAASPAIKQDLDRANPARPWRVLLLNRSICATRSHDPAAMESAFHDLGQWLPDDAPEFFAEGLQQMDPENTPTEVLDLLKSYLQRWKGGQH